MSPDIKVILAILAGLTASALARFSNGPSAADTYTGGFLYWLGYSGFDLCNCCRNSLAGYVGVSESCLSRGHEPTIGDNFGGCTRSVWRDRQVTSDVRFIPTATCAVH